MAFTDFLNLLENLTEDAKPIWGEMSPQHMVEHLTYAVQLSNGNFEINDCMTPNEKLPIMKRFLMSPRPLPKNFTNTIVGAELKPLKNINLESAITELKNELNQINLFFEENKDTLPVNPTFGPLNKEEWIQFHKKHLTHHLEQFGLIEQ